jgi:CheY-like chemotaxis protein
VRSVIAQNEPAASAKNLRVDSELSPAAGVVIADGTRIRQVVWNLLINAVKFTPEGGQISVSLERVNDEVRFRISDTGAGIAPEFLPNVFDRFRQYEASITRRYGGLGLGLTISKQLVEMHGGTIRAESAGLGEGATFTVTLPLRAVRRPSPASNGSAHDLLLTGVALRGAKILLVEDDAETQAALSAVLRQAGASVTAVSSGAAALDAYRLGQPHILLSDVGLPDIDGYTLLGRIRAFERERSLAEVCAVALSAYARDEDRKKAADAGFTTHLAKPVQAETLIAMLNTLTEIELTREHDG